MGTRKRFTPAERQLFVVGTEVEWLNASTWRPGVISGGITTDSIGRQYVAVKDQGKTTRTFTGGQLVRAYCKSIRIKPCSCGTPHQARWHLNLIIGKGDSRTGTDTTYFDFYFCDTHLPAQSAYLSLLTFDGHEEWYQIEATLSALTGADRS